MPANYEYQLNLDGTRAGVVETNDLGGQTSITWTYDGLNRLVKEEYDLGNDGPSTGDYATTYTMNLVGNRLTKSTDNYDDGNLDESADETISYDDYDANDRLLSESLDSDGDGVVDETTTYGYSATEQTNKTAWQGTDASGSGTKISETTYTYNVQGRMSKVEIDTNGDGTIETTTAYAYDDRGVRVEQAVTEGTTTTTTEYLIDPRNDTGYAKQIEEYVDGALDKTYTLGHAVIAQHDATNGVLTFLHDGHGSTRALLAGANAVIQQRFAYDAYGETLEGTNLTSADAALTTWLFAGDGAYDPSTGLTNHILRWRDGGRFLSLDSYAGNMQDPQSLHKYLYAHANPVTGADPTGMFTLPELVGSISNMVRVGVRVIRPIANAYRRIDSVLDTIESVRFASTVIRTLSRAIAEAGTGGGGVATAVFSALQAQLRISPARFGRFLSPIDDAVTFVGTNWKRTQRRILRHADQMAFEVAREPVIAGMLTSAVASREVGLVIDLPSEPGGAGRFRRNRTLRLPVIPVGDKGNIVIQSDRRLGRLIGFGFATGRTLKRNDINIINLLRIDYQDFRGSTFGLDLHYHVGADPRHRPIPHI